MREKETFSRAEERFFLFALAPLSSLTICMHVRHVSRVLPVGEPRAWTEAGPVGQTSWSKKDLERPARIEKGRRELPAQWEKRREEGAPSKDHGLQRQSSMRSPDSAE